MLWRPLLPPHLIPSPVLVFMTMRSCTCATDAFIALGPLPSLPCPLPSTRLNSSRLAPGKITPKSRRQQVTSCLQCRDSHDDIRATCHGSCDQHPPLAADKRRPAGALFLGGGTWSRSEAGTGTGISSPAIGIDKSTTSGRGLTWAN